MKSLTAFLFVTSIMLSLSSNANAEKTALGMARGLENSNVTQHDPTFDGLELLYYSPNGAGILLGRLAMRRKANKAWNQMGVNRLVKRTRVSGNFVVGRRR